jgi:hypothetical protein
MRHPILGNGGYTVLDMHGDWLVSPDDYGGAVYRFMDDVGTPPDFCSPQDWPFTHPSDTCRGCDRVRREHGGVDCCR